MAVVKGMGPCAIPGENGLPCGRQIVEGEPVGTVVKGTAYNPLPMVGHKRCADAFYARVRQTEKEQNTAMVQRLNQAGAGGPVDPSTAFSPVQGSIPLEKPEPPANIPSIQGDMSQGAHFIGDVPEGATPDQAVQYAKGEPIKVMEPRQAGRSPMMSESLGEALNQPTRSLGTAPASAFFNAPLTEVVPTVDANDGKVVVTLGHLQTQIAPADGEDFISMLEIAIRRAKRQQVEKAHSGL